MNRLFFISVLLISVFNTHPSLAQKKLQCGLLTNFSMSTTTKIYTASETDIKLLSAINNELKVSTYMNKALAEGTRKIYISLFTSGTYNDFIAKINGSKHAFLNQKTISKTGVDFSCYSFKFSDKTVTRIVYNEPQLTLCVSFDILTVDTITDYNKYYNEIINRISFIAAKK